jgi:hypothetical protein
MLTSRSRRTVAADPDGVLGQIRTKFPASRLRRDSARKGLRAGGYLDEVASGQRAAGCTNRCPAREMLASGMSAATGALSL